MQKNANIYADICENKDNFRKSMQKYAQNMQIYAIKFAQICINMQKNVFYMPKYMQIYVNILTVIAKHAKICKNMQETCKKYARNMQEI